MLEENLKVPKERIAVLIGPKGKIKSELEKKGKVKIKVDSHSGEVCVKGEEKEPLKFYISTNIVKAIARGFSPEHAFKLLDEEYYLDVIDIEEFGDSEKDGARLRGRVIGKEGRTRQTLEEELNVLVSVYGKTISLIGRPEDMEKARKAVEMLLKGSSHLAMERFLKKQTSEQGISNILE
ncbi:MAG: KH domain-containing protein [Candidatus Diapherotrites archaeon]